MFERYYRALVERDPEFDGVFYVGVKSTGVFCRCVCPARKPKRENCEFFTTAQDALLAGFRPCKRCRPLSHPDAVPEVVTRLVEAVEREPEKRWRSGDFRELSTNSVQASRLFKKRFGMTFVAYARARRMGIAMGDIKNGGVMDAQIGVGYESGSGFRDAFARIMGAPPAKSDQVDILKAEWIDTPLGPMLAIADDRALHLLEFVERRGLEREIERLRKRLFAIVPGNNAVLDSIKRELKEYFDGELQSFKTPISVHGTPFQKRVWEALLTIPYGSAWSYAQLACAIGKKTAFRAVAGANGANQLALIIPCHRVINADGKIGGYGGGVPRKEWLLAHEKKYF